MMHQSSSSSSSSSLSLCAEKKHWWLTSRKVSNRYIRDARSLIATQDPADVTSALNLLDAALAHSPRHENALELKARCLLFLRRYRDVANMLQDYIPSFKPPSPDEEDDHSSTSLSSDTSSPRDRAKLIYSDPEDDSFRCLSVSDLKKKVLAGLRKHNHKEGHWRYVILGQACFHLGMMEDAMVLLQTGRRLATAAYRRESHEFDDDNFFNPRLHLPSFSSTSPPVIAPTELDSAANLLAHIKFLLRRRSAASAALDAGHPAESVRHFSKLLDSRRGLPHPFASACYVGRAAAHRTANRLADAIADCNRALSLDPTCIPALRSRAEVFEALRALPDCLRDLDHLKLLYDAVLRDRKLPGPIWKPHPDIRYRDVPGLLRSLGSRILELRQKVGKGEGWSLDYHGLLGVRRGCSRSELERAHLLLVIRHKPEKAAAFVDRLEYCDVNRDLDMVRDQARMSGLVLYRMLQKGYSCIMAAVKEEEAAEKNREKENAAAAAAAVVVTAAAIKVDKESGEGSNVVKGAEAASPAFQGVFCRDMAAVGSLISQVGFGRALPVKYEALSC